LHPCSLFSIEVLDRNKKKEKMKRIERLKK
jgi:hypothetical protein